MAEWKWSRGGRYPVPSAFNKLCDHSQVTAALCVLIVSTDKTKEIMAILSFFKVVVRVRKSRECEMLYMM